MNRQSGDREMADSNPRTTGDKRVHAFVISWSGYSDAAMAIARALGDHVEELTVIHSDPTGAPPRNAGLGDRAGQPLLRYEVQAFAGAVHGRRDAAGAS